jgi:hypothetical protein
MRRVFHFLTPALGMASLLTSTAFGQTTAEDPPPSAGAVGVAEGAAIRETDQSGEARTTKTLDPGEIDRAQAAELANSPYERPKQNYYFTGLRYRGIVIPRFYMNLFGDGGTTVWVNGIGPELTVRKDRFEYVFSLWYGNYGMDETPFKAFTDPNQSWEVVESKLHALHLTTDFNWTSEVTPAFGVNVGVGAGFMVIWGKLLRTQAYPENGDEGDWESYVACNGPGDPNGEFCSTTDNPDHYGLSEPSWASGGSKPFFFPWLALQTGVRIKPHRNFMMRIEGGISDLGFFIGAAGNYGI